MQYPVRHRWRLLPTVLACLAVTACGTTKKNLNEAFMNRSCGTTPVTREDLRQFNVNPAPGKVTVVRFIRSSCPYCKEDLQQMGLLLNTGQWNPEKIQIVLIAYKKPGVETRETFDAFVRDLPSSGFPIEKAQIVYVDKTYPTLLKAKGRSGELLLAGWKAVPFSLVFGTDDRLAYRGHFTISNRDQNLHYDFIGDLQNETCAPGLRK